MTRKRNIFIGCSKKERSLAEQAKEVLESDFDVTIWDDSLWETSTEAFKLNDSILQGLLRSSLQFDFAIMIGTTDDKVEKKGEIVLQARDNVLFELGLFMGRMGLRNCAFIVDRQLDIMEDLKGIILSKFEYNNETSFKIAAEKVKQSFIKNQDCAVNFFPSATLAAAYFENLILPTYYYLVGSNGLEIEGEKYKNWKFKIVIPKSLAKDVNVQFQSYKNDNEIKGLTIEAPGRVRKLLLETNIENGIPVIVDFPTILAGINHAIKHLLPNEFNQTSEDYAKILERELERFKTSLMIYASHEVPDLSNRITFESIN
jgi:hypothetical protein